MFYLSRPRAATIACAQRSGISVRVSDRLSHPGGAVESRSRGPTNIPLRWAQSNLRRVAPATFPCARRSRISVQAPGRLSLTGDVVETRIIPSPNIRLRRNSGNFVQGADRLLLTSDIVETSSRGPTDFCLSSKQRKVGPAVSPTFAYRCHNENSHKRRRQHSLTGTTTKTRSGWPAIFRLPLT